MNPRRAVGVGVLVAALIAASNILAPGSALASLVTIHGQMFCNGTDVEWFTGVARANTVTHFPNPDCSNGRPGIRAFFPEM